MADLQVIELQVIGGGRMGEALVGGLLQAGGVRRDGVRIVEADPARREVLQAAFPGVDVADVPDAADGHIVAVKPPDVPAACAAVSAYGPTRVLSIAAGVTIASLEVLLAPGSHVVRAMPNTPALVGVGAAAIAPGSAADDADLVWAESLLGAVGTVVRVEEGLLDAVTGLSGSGPAYVFLVAEALIEAGVRAGLPLAVSEALSVQTLLGAATLLADSDDGPEALRAAVTSPGGTTVAGLEVLEHHGVRAAFIEAVAAAAERSRQLGRESPTSL
jgi:pyrroline-5-carboxylate reductase